MRFLPGKDFCCSVTILDDLFVLSESFRVARLGRSQQLVELREALQLGEVNYYQQIEQMLRAF